MAEQDGPRLIFPESLANLPSFYTNYSGVSYTADDVTLNLYQLQHSPTGEDQAIAVARITMTREQAKRVVMMVGRGLGLTVIEQKK